MELIILEKKILGSINKCLLMLVFDNNRVVLYLSSTLQSINMKKIRKLRWLPKRDNDINM